MVSSPTYLHEAWALAGLLKGIYGEKAGAQAQAEAERHQGDAELRSIWTSVVDCLAAQGPVSRDTHIIH